MAIRKNSENARDRILASCIKLFLERGYEKTTMAEIVADAEVSNSTFQNLFHTKSGVLKDLVGFAFELQFKSSKSMAADMPDPVYIYAAEIALQLAISEYNENVREIYLKAYTCLETAEHIYTLTAKELHRIFSAYRPECSESDFYELDMGTSGMIYAYMARPCGVYFTLEKKIERFLDMALRVYGVPEELRKSAAEYALGLDIKATADRVVRNIFEALEKKFDFEFDNYETEATE